MLGDEAVFIGQRATKDAHIVGLQQRISLSFNLDGIDVGRFSLTHSTTVDSVTFPVFMVSAPQVFTMEKSMRTTERTPFPKMVAFKATFDHICVDVATQT